MTILAINWGFALLVLGIGMGTTFTVLVLLIGLINVQSRTMKSLEERTKKEPEKEVVLEVTTETHPTPHEQAAIAMAMHLYFDAHDEEPHVITIEEVERRYSPWSSKIYGMRNLNK